MISKNEFHLPSRKLPEIGKRVKCLIIKEMIYKGNMQENSSEWVYDGKGGTLYFVVARNGC